MVVLAQVAVEYAVLASRDAPKDSHSVSELIERITTAVPSEYIVIALGVLVVAYLIKKVFDAVY